MRELEERIERVEVILFELALRLRRVPLAEDTTKLHIRALELKRRLIAWRTSLPSANECEEMLTELASLSREVSEVAPHDVARRTI